jgi:hypothetical protein
VACWAANVQVGPAGVPQQQLFVTVQLFCTDLQRCGTQTLDGDDGFHAAQQRLAITKD